MGAACRDIPEDEKKKTKYPDRMCFTGLQWNLGPPAWLGHQLTRRRYIGGAPQWPITETASQTISFTLTTLLVDNYNQGSGFALFNYPIMHITTRAFAISYDLAFTLFVQGSGNTVCGSNPT